MDLTKFFNDHRHDYKSVEIPHEDYKPQGSYIYEWFTLEPRKIFYVGKGKNKRYNHILKEIEKAIEGRGRGSQKGKFWEDLRDNLGIDCHIVVDGLTPEEAEDLEVCFIINRLVEGQPLLQHIIPWEDDRLTDTIYKRWTHYNYPPKGTKHSDLIK